MKTRQVLLLFGLVAVASVGACDESSKAIPAVDSTTPQGVRCTLVMGGGGVVTPDPDVNSTWFVINRAVTNGAIAALKDKGYDVREFIVAIQDGDERFAAMSLELDRQHCGQVLQITNNLIGDANSGGRVTQFTFRASVIHLVEDPHKTDKPGRWATVVGDYEKIYTYPITQEVMDTLSLSGLGETIVADAEAAKVLNSRAP